MTRITNRLRLGAATAAWLALCSAGPALAVEYVADVWASGLNSPRGLSFAPDGALWITESGSPGGTGPSTIVRGETLVYNTSGSLTRVAGGVQSRLLSGLPAMFIASSGQMEGGVTDIGFGPDGSMSLLFGYIGADPALRFTDLAPVGHQFGRLVTLAGNPVDIAAHEAAFNPDGAGVESNPWRMALSGSGAYVTDAAGNSLLQVAADGSISTLAVFGPRDLGGPFPTQSVPTGVAVAPDGAVFVGELTGFPFVPGAARVHRVAAGGTPEVWAEGFTMIIDLAFDAAGELYVLEHDSNGLLQPGSVGRLWHVGAGGARELVWSDGLVNPTGLAIGADGAFYVANFGNDGAGFGQVLRISAVPDVAGAAPWLLGLAVLGWTLRRRRGA